MKKKVNQDHQQNENQDTRQNKTVKRPRVSIWKCVISIVLCMVFAAVIVLGVMTYMTNTKIAALRADLDSAMATLEAIRGESTSDELDQLKNEYAQIQKALNEALEALKTENQSFSQRLEALEGENQSLLQEIEKLKDRLQSSGEGKIRIYIDQGHNPVPYHNSGAEGNGLYEHDLTFIIGCALAELLKEDGRFEICLSRPNKGVVLGTDNASSQKARVDDAENFDADYLISLHINSYTDGTPHGIEVYTADTGTTSYAFGESLLEGLVEATGLRDRGMKQNAELYILKTASMPAVLLEMGFISNANDAALLAEQPELFAQGIYDGILEYFGLSAPEVETN